jgi:hypothetical protein
MGCCLLNLSPLNCFDRRCFHNTSSASVNLFLRVLAILMISRLNSYHPHPYPPPSEGEGKNYSPPFPLRKSGRKLSFGQIFDKREGVNSIWSGNSLFSIIPSPGGRGEVPHPFLSIREYGMSLSDREGEILSPPPVPSPIKSPSTLTKIWWWGCRIAAGEGNISEVSF